MNGTGPLARAMELFEGAFDADRERRAALLARVLEREPTAHAHLLRLLAADAAAEDARFLDRPALCDVPRGELEGGTPGEEDAGRRLGAWRLERLLGSGGAGDVWLARRADGLHEGAAAIKRLRGAGVDASFERRFAREGRLLARLEHPHIARLLDVGQEEDGRRFLVLELVLGERIDAFCDRARATLAARLRVFLQVCDAVSYAHENLIVHRDLKPSNILVEGSGTAKLLDFGIAKLLEAEDDARERTELTRAGRAPFTPEYAAPEQLDGGPVTVATDVYSLGVVLYLLLAGRRPFDDLGAPRGRALLREEPPRLSSGSSEEIARAASLRATTPRELRRALRGDLETIAAKALKRDPKERYPTAVHLASDVRRYLECRPILARGDSALYRACKFVLRHRLSVAVAAVMLFTACVALAVQARRVEREAARATSIKNLLLDSFISADPDRTGGEPAKDLPAILERVSSRLDEERGMGDEARAEAHATLGNLFSAWNRYDEAQAHFGRAADLYRHLYGERSTEALRVEASAVVDEMHHGRFSRLAPRVDRLLSDIDGEDRPKADRQGLRWTALEVLARTARGTGDLPRARAIAERFAAEVRAAPGDAGQLSESLQLLTWIANDEGAPIEGERTLLEAIAIDRPLCPPLDERMAVDLLSAVDVLRAYGDDEDAEPAAAKALELRLRGFGPRHIATAWAYVSSAVVADDLGRDRDADRLFDAASAIAARVSPPNPTGVAVIHYAVGMHLLLRRDWDGARARLSECVRDLDAVSEVWHWRQGECAAGLAYAEAHAGERGAAARLDALIEAERAHRSRDLPLSLWLRARLGVDGLTGDGPPAQLARLEEAAALLATTGRGGSRLGRDVEAARRALGAPPAEPAPARGRALAVAAREIVVAATP